MDYKIFLYKRIEVPGIDLATTFSLDLLTDQLARENYLAIGILPY